MTNLSRSEVAPSRDYRRNRFFVWIAVAMLIVIALGFGKSFYLRPFSGDNSLPVYLVVHGVTMTVWYLIFMAQVSLIKLGRTDLHRKLGIAGVVLAVGVVVTGVVVQLNVIPRWQALGYISNPQDLSRSVAFVLVGLSMHIPFAILIVLAVMLRRKAAVHKRLMFWAFVWTLGPALTGTRPLGQVLDALTASFLPFFPADLLWFGALLAYDWKTQRRIHPATYVGFFSLAFYFFFVTEWIADIDALQQWLRIYVQAHSL